MIIKRDSCALLTKILLFWVCCRVCHRNVIFDVKFVQKLYFYCSLGELVIKYDTALLLVVKVI